MVMSMLKSDFAKTIYNVDVKTLMRWINTNKKLVRDLKKTGYTPRSKILTPLQIALIREKFG